ncbi:MAG: hypothetical protein ACYC6C_07000 [Coriobacteriia bacterium]
MKLDPARGIAAVGGAGWLLSLPFLGVGMGCFWLQSDMAGVPGTTLGVLAVVFLAAALLLPGLLPWIFAVNRSSLPVAVAKSLGVALVSLVVASLLSAVEALRPEDVSFFGSEFASAHALAAAVPTAFALAIFAAALWRRGPDGRMMWIAPGVVASVLGVGLWWWSAGVGYHAIRFTNADEIVLMTQTVALGGLLFASVLAAIVFAPHMKRAAARFTA